MPTLIVRRETADDVATSRQVEWAAFAPPDAGNTTPVEVTLLDALRLSDAWMPQLSLVAEVDGVVLGHVVCTRAHVDAAAVVALGPIGVLPDRHGNGIGSAMMHAVLGAADALGEPLVGLLGSREFYDRFGFQPAADFGIAAPDPSWGDHFQVRPLATLLERSGRSVRVRRARSRNCDDRGRRHPGWTDTLLLNRVHRR